MAQALSTLGFHVSTYKCKVKTHKRASLEIFLLNVALLDRTRVQSPGPQGHWQHLKVECVASYIHIYISLTYVHRYPDRLAPNDHLQAIPDLKHY